MNRIRYPVLWILFLGLTVMALGQVPEFVTQRIQLFFDFDASENWEGLWHVVSGRWDVIEDAPGTGNYVLTQTVRYLDFPKIYLEDREFFDYQAGVDVKILPVRGETQPVKGTSIYEIPDIKQQEIAQPHDYAGGLLVRYRGPFAFKALIVDARRGEVLYFQMSAYGPKIVVRKKVSVRLNEWHRLEIICETDVMEARWDGQPLFSRRERGITGGRVGLVTIGASHVLFDRFQIRSEEIRPVEKQEKKPDLLPW